MLTIKIKSGKFKKDTDLIGKMDPFVRVRIGNNSQRTETAKSQGKTPTWTTTLSFEITPEQYSQPDNVEVIFEASDEDSPTTAEFLGRVSYKLAIIKAKVKEVTTLHLMNDKNKEIGTIDVELELQPTPPKLVGTVIVRPAEGKFEMGKTKKQDMCLTFVHNGIVCQTEIQDGPDGKLVFKTPILFQLYEGQDMVIRCMENKPKKPATLGEGQFQLDALAKQGNVPNLPVTFLNKGKKVAELNIELEFLKDLFGNPVRIYPVLSVGKGQCLCKKMMYSNPDMMKKSIKVISENKNLVLVKTEALTLMPNETGEMKFEINLPFGKQEGKCRVDIVVEETQMIEETLFFRVKAA